jgi:hypothetical protein
MKIIITEKQHTLLNQVIQEQGFGGAAGIVGSPQQVFTPKETIFPCLGNNNLRPFVIYVQKNKNKICQKLNITSDLLSLLTKVAIGIMKRESDYNQGLMSVGEYLLDAFDDTFLSRKLKKSGKLGSVGPAQFRYDTWKNLDMEKKFGMNRNDMREITGAGLGTIVLTLGNYKKALSLGYSKTTKSVNPFLTKKGINFRSTNNAALDMAIVSHNMSIIDKYCYTSNPTLAGPCKNPTYDPYKKGSPGYKKYGTLNVYQNKPILNYFPNKKYGNQTSIGYLEEVVDVVNSLNCIKI